MIPIEIEGLTNDITKPVIDLFDKNIDNPIIGETDNPIVNPSEEPKKVYVMQNPYNYMVSRLDNYFVSENKQEIIGIVTDWNEKCGDYLDYTMAENRQCQPVTIKGVSKEPKNVLDLSKSMFGLQPSDEYFTTVDSIPDYEDYKSEVDMLSSRIKNIINTHVNKHIMNICEFNSKE